IVRGQCVLPPSRVSLLRRFKGNDDLTVIDIDNDFAPEMLYAVAGWFVRVSLDIGCFNFYPKHRDLLTRRNGQVGCEVDTSVLSLEPSDLVHHLALLVRAITIYNQSPVIALISDLLRSSSLRIRANSRSWGFAYPFSIRLKRACDIPICRAN